MFKLSDAPDTYTWPVVVEIPADGGNYREARFTARFQLQPQDVVDEVLQKIRDEDDQDEDTDLAVKLLVGWEDVQGADGQPLVYSDESKHALLNIPYVRGAVVRAYFASLGGKKARRKN